MENYSEISLNSLASLLFYVTPILEERTLKEWSYRVMIWEKRAGNYYWSPTLSFARQQTSVSTSHMIPWWWWRISFIDCSQFVNLGISSLKMFFLFFFHFVHAATTTIAFSHQICPYVTPHPQVWKWFGLNSHGTAGKFHHSWMGDFVPHFFSLSPLCIMTQTTFLSNILFSLSFRK